MTEYTPTTDQVRRYWQYGANAWLAEQATDNDHGPDGSIGAEFDRWLAEHDRQVKTEAWDEGAKWGALQVAGLPDTSPDYVQIKDGSNPYRQGDTND